MSYTKKITICSICVALCCVLPLAFHSLGLGSVFSPMHIPVLLCGLLCPWPYGLFCGIAGPVLSSMLSGMPPAAALVHMVPELCVYGAVCGLVTQRVRTKHVYADLYLALVPAMLLGRVAAGLARAAFYLGGTQGYPFALWASSYLFEAVPGIVLHLALVPTLAVVLMKAKLVPDRCGPKAEGQTCL